LAPDHAETQVSRGENSGRKLTYTSVLRTLERVGTLRAGDSFSKDIHLKLERGADPRSLRLIAFVQEPGYGKVAGAAMRDRKSTRLNSSHVAISYAAFCLKKKKISKTRIIQLA